MGLDRGPVSGGNQDGLAGQVPRVGFVVDGREVGQLAAVGDEADEVRRLVRRRTPEQPDTGIER